MMMLKSFYYYIFQNLMSLLAALHCILPCLFALLYVYFIVFLNHIVWLTFLLIGILLIFFVLYGLAAYGIFHRSPGYQTYKDSEKKIEVQNIAQYKQNSMKLYSLQMQMKEDITYQRLKALQIEYIARYQQNSFCDTCEIIQSPRTYHCKSCDKCIVRRQKHSELIGLCIGVKNMKIFMQYMFIAMFLSFFMMLSLILITVLEHHKLNDFSDIQLTMFAFIEMALGCSCVLFSKEFIISYINAVDNITETQRKKGIITKKNNPFNQQHYYEELFKSRLEYLKVNQIADPVQWLELNEEHT